VFKMRSLTSLRTLAASIAVGLSLLAGSVAISAPDVAAVQKVRLDGRDFEIPQRYFDEGSRVPTWLRWLPGLDDGSRELLLTIKASEVAASVPGFIPNDGSYSDDLRLRVVVLRPVE